MVCKQLYLDLEPTSEIFDVKSQLEKEESCRVSCNTKEPPGKRRATMVLKRRRETIVKYRTYPQLYVSLQAMRVLASMGPGIGVKLLLPRT